jgi:Mitochondrial carrier protein
MGISDTDAKRRSKPAPQQQAGIGRLFLSGAVAACIAEATTLPLDTAKVNSEHAACAHCDMLSNSAGKAVVGIKASCACWSQVRLQLQTLVYGADKSVHLPPKYRGPFQTVLKIVEEEGVRAPFKGLSPGLHRQVRPSE